MGEKRYFVLLVLFFCMCKVSHVNIDRTTNEQMLGTEYPVADFAEIVDGVPPEALGDRMEVRLLSNGDWQITVFKKTQGDHKEENTIPPEIEKRTIWNKDKKKNTKWDFRKHVFAKAVKITAFLHEEKGLTISYLKENKVFISPLENTQIGLYWILQVHPASPNSWWATRSAK